MSSLFENKGIAKVYLQVVGRRGGGSRGILRQAPVSERIRELKFLINLKISTTLIGILFLSNFLKILLHLFFDKMEIILLSSVLPTIIQKFSPIICDFVIQSSNETWF